jgi:predicted phage tail protein
MSKILLYGNLAEKYGKEFIVNIYSVPEAIACLSANFSSFKHDLLKNEKYNVYIDDRDIDENELDIRFNNNSKTIKIVPIIGGASGGAKMIAGAALIALSFTPLFPGAAAFGATGFQAATGLAGAVFNIGVGMLFSGFAELLYSPPEGDIDDEGSYMFSGAENTTKQGSPVQVGYGTVLVGSTLISIEFNNINLLGNNQSSRFK